MHLQIQHVSMAKTTLIGLGMRKPRTEIIEGRRIERR
jgi:hypothetical protein